MAEMIEVLDKEFKNYKTRKRVETSKEKQEDLAWKKKLTDFKANELKLLPKKIELYKNILAWRNKFIKSKQFKKVFHERDECVIFWNGWAHELPRFGGPGCWSRLYLEETGKLRYWAGYKWMPTGPEIVFTDNLKNAEEFTYKYLEELDISIKTGKVYKTIAEELKEDY